MTSVHWNASQPCLQPFSTLQMISQCRWLLAWHAYCSVFSLLRLTPVFSICCCVNSKGNTVVLCVDCGWMSLFTDLGHCWEVRHRLHTRWRERQYECLLWCRVAVWIQHSLWDCRQTRWHTASTALTTAPPCCPNHKPSTTVKPLKARRYAELKLVCVLFPESKCPSVEVRKRATNRMDVITNLCMHQLSNHFPTINICHHTNYD